MKNITILLILILSTLLFSGSINGYVFDENDTPLIGANIIIVNTDLGNTTDEEGYFDIDNLESGKYSFKEIKTNFNLEELPPFSVKGKEKLINGWKVKY